MSGNKKYSLVVVIGHMAFVSDADSLLQSDRVDISEDQYVKTVRVALGLMRSTFFVSLEEQNCGGSLYLGSLKPKYRADL